jgi:hypothetical protein
MRSAPLLFCTALALTLSACGGASEPAPGADEAGLGGVGSVEGTADWGAATTCKALPTGLPALKDPVVVISLDGLTLHLWDRQGSFDKVYPIGPGAVENGKSLTPVGHFTTGPADSTAGAADDGTKVGSSPWAWWYRCKMWWTDPDTKQISPVYGGLPLIRLAGAPTLGYAIHGPIDNFGAPNGGSLRRGYVSHGCVRMRAADIGEVYVLLHGHSHAPVTIQRAVERDDQGRAVDLAQRWVGSECQSAADCNFAGGVCQPNAYGRSFCTMACSGGCPDRVGEIATACVPDGRGSGMCVRQASALNNFCRYAESFADAPQTLRFGRATRVDVCVPGSAGFVGDPCLSSSDCASGRTCERSADGGPGFCTQTCDASHACPSANGLSSSCVQGRCVRSCDVQDACGVATATTCARVGTAFACIP